MRPLSTRASNRPYSSYSKAVSAKVQAEDLSSCDTMKKVINLNLKSRVVNKTSKLHKAIDLASQNPSKNKAKLIGKGNINLFLSDFDSELSIPKIISMP